MLEMKSLPEQDLLKTLFEYEDGYLIRKIRTSNRDKIGNNPWSVNSAGYFLITINSQHYTLHRIIWKYHTGKNPGIIDHINGDPLDNRIENLREVTASQSAINRKVRIDNKVGHTGISWNRKLKKYQIAASKPYEKLTYLGLTNNLEEAIRIRKDFINTFQNGFGRNG